MQFKLRALLAGALLAATVSSAAVADTFEQCDGYGTPSSGGDGMTKEATQFFGLIRPLGSNGNTRRTTPALGTQGVASCDAALADSRLADRYWLRRASLLRARAVHDLALNRPDDALTDVAKAVTAVRDPQDPFVGRSMLLGADLVRGYALVMKGDVAEGARLIGDAQSKRPFDRRLGLAAVLVLGQDPAPAERQRAIQALARLDPRLIVLLSDTAFDRDDFETVVALHPHLKAFTKTLDIGVSGTTERIEEAKQQLQEIKFAADSGGRYAYALAALGHPDQARSAIAEARDRIRFRTPAALAPLAPGEQEGSKARLSRNITDTLIQTASKANSLLDAWEQDIAVRAAFAGEDPAKGLQAMMASKIPARGVALDMIGTLGKRLPDDPSVKALIAKAAAADSAPPKIDGAAAKLLFESLPHTEIAQRIATYRKANSALVGYFWGGISGFKTYEGATPNQVKVEFTGEKSSESVVQEMTLLRAADFARERGSSGFVILNRSDYERTVRTMYYGSVLRTDPQGYSCTLDVELVDADNPPEQYKSAPWRVIRAAEVLQTLGPIYMQPADAAATKATN